MFASRRGTERKRRAHHKVGRRDGEMSNAQPPPAATGRPAGNVVCRTHEAVESNIRRGKRSEEKQNAAGKNNGGECGQRVSSTPARAHPDGGHTHALMQRIPLY